MKRCSGCGKISFSSNRFCRWCGHKNSGLNLEQAMKEVELEEVMNIKLSYFYNDNCTEKNHQEMTQLLKHNNYNKINGKLPDKQKYCNKCGKKLL